MSNFIDSYYLVDNRNSSIIYEFFRQYSFAKKATADDYPIPQYEDFSKTIFYSDRDLLMYMEKDTTCEYLIYWHNLNENSLINQITLQYTNDKKMIFGVSIIGNEIKSTQSLLLFKDVKLFFKSKVACITIDEPPPVNSIEFINFCKNRYIPFYFNTCFYVMWKLFFKKWK